MLEEKLVIQPHIGKCKVQVILRNNENQNRDEYTGLVVEHVEIRPMALRAEAQGKYPCSQSRQEGRLTTLERNPYLTM